MHLRRTSKSKFSTSRRLFLESLEDRRLFAVWNDPYFGDSGQAFAVITSDNLAVEAAVKSDGKIVVAGDGTGGAARDFLLAQFNSDGTPDLQFGSTGVSFNLVDRATDMALQSDDKIIVVGTTQAATADFALARFTSNGILDGSFGGAGKVTTPVGSGDDVANAVIVQSDGKIVVAGYSTATNRDFAVVRYNTDGSLDSSFDGDGKASTFFGAGDDNAFSVVQQTDGKLLVAGISFNGVQNQFALARFNANGTLDTSFDGDGRVTTTLGGVDDVAVDMVLQSDGKIVAVGWSSNGLDDDFALVRYNTDGSLDTTFDGDGRVTTDVNVGTNEHILSVAIQPDGKILVAGECTNGNIEGAFILARYNSNGSLDQTFDGDGKDITVVGPTATSFPTSVVLQSDGKIVVAGHTGAAGSRSIAVARFVETKPTLTSFVVPSHGLQGRRIRLSSLATDLNQLSSTLSYQWTVSGPGGFQTTLNTANPNFVAPSAGSYAVTLLVTDAEGLTATATGNVIAENEAPTISSFVVPTHANEGERVRLSGTATDPNQSVVSLTYSWDITGPGGFQATLPGRNVSFIAPDNGVFTAELTATDNGALSAILTDTLVVANVAPTITKYLVPTTGKINKVVKLAALAADPAGAKDALIYTWLIKGPKAYSTTLTGPKVNWTPPATIGKYVVKLTVTDGDGGQALMSSSINVT